MRPEAGLMRMSYHKDVPPPLLYLLPVFSTLLGGLLAVRLRRYLSLVSAIGAGLLLGAALLDLLPEAVVLGRPVGLGAGSLGLVAVGAFGVFYGMEWGLQGLARLWQGGGRKLLGRVGAGLMIFHSLRDGMAIGAAYLLSHHAGYAVALGIAAHDVADGLNTVLLATAGEKPGGVDWGFLVADAAAPVVGVVVTTWWVVSARGSAVLLAVAAGFFVQLAVAELGPRVWGRRVLLAAT